MHYTIEGLVGGKPVELWYQRAVEHWQEKLSEANATDSQAIALVADREQMWFERNCGGRWVGQEIMVVSGIGQYYSTTDGFGPRIERARAMYRGLGRSRCSGEIHHRAEDMAKIYAELEEKQKLLA